MLSAHSIHVLYGSLLMQAPTGQCGDDTKLLCLVTCIALTRLYRAIDWLHKLLIQQRQHISQKQPSCIALVRPTRNGLQSRFYGRWDNLV